MAISLPIYYQGNINEIPYKPIIVAPYKQYQDTLIVAPDYISNDHDKFIDNLYHSTEGYLFNKQAVRGFKYSTEYCVAVIIPVTTKDSSGRKGQKIAIGFLFDTKMIDKSPNTLIISFQIFFRQLNEILSTCFPSGNGDKLIEVIESSNSNEDFISKINNTIDIFHLASVIISERLPAQAKKRNIFKLFLKRRKIKKSIPKLLLFPENSDELTIIKAVIGQLWKCIPHINSLVANGSTIKKDIDFTAIQVIEKTFNGMQLAEIGNTKNAQYLIVS